MFFRFPATFSRPAHDNPAPAIDIVDLMLAFESLGDNCEFGLLQRRCGADPQGLLRLAFCRLATLEAMLACDLRGVMDEGDLDLAAHPLYPDKLLARSARLRDLDHTVTRARDGDDRALQLRRIAYLRRRFLDDLREGTKIFVRRGRDSRPETMGPFLDQFRRSSRAWLLLVVETEDPALHGTVGLLGERYLVGRVERLAITGDVLDSEVETWVRVLLAAYGHAHGHAPAPVLRANRPLALPSTETFGDCGVRRLRSRSGEERCVVVAFARDMVFDETIYSVVFDDAPPGLRSFVCALPVFVPASFDGTYLRLLTTTAARQMDRQADLRKRDVWQRIWVHGHLSLGMSRLVVQLRTDARETSVLMLGRIEIEAGTYPNPQAATLDLPAAIPS